MPAARKAWFVAAVIAVAAVVAVVGASLFWSADRDSASTVRLRPDDAAVATLGRQVHAAHCAACHGARLEGQPQWRERGLDGRLPAPPHDGGGRTWHRPDELLFRITKLGVARAVNPGDHVSAMPAYEDVLGDEEIVAVLSWIKAQWPPDIRARHDELNRMARH